ncbi:hypothetical protein E2C01_009531 [Portunus trituberculatus]|uniref:Uncharacterized protein n=1 Tax=Portunus trituberculatus TaxID=210409 RepID=A0A5B7D613_PORTR|nr:hypothetical protein [Portunus trituberculatus]
MAVKSTQQCLTIIRTVLLDPGLQGTKDANKISLKPRTVFQRRGNNSLFAPASQNTNDHPFRKCTTHAGMPQNT